MKVAYVGNFAVSFSTESHIALAWEANGHEVLRISEQQLDWTALPSTVAGSDLFLWTRTAGFDPPNAAQVQAEALAQITIPKVGYHLDRWWGLDRESWIGESPFFWATDFLCTADGGHDQEWASRGITHHWFPPAILGAEAVLGQPSPKYRAKVGFVGNLTSYGHPEWAPYRRELHRLLRQRYRNWFRIFPEQGRSQIRGKALADLYASVPVLIGDSCLSGEATRYWSDRIPETMGRGGFLIHPEVEGLHAEHNELIFYPLGDLDRLCELIDWWLDNDPAREQQRGWQRIEVLERHTYEHRMRRLETLI